MIRSIDDLFYRQIQKEIDEKLMAEFNIQIYMAEFKNILRYITEKKV